jgi:ribonuclease HI
LGTQQLAELRGCLNILSIEDNWMAMQNYVLATTDGACSGNPGPGGWAVLLNDELRSRKSPCTTNNAMELTAILMAVDMCPVNVNLLIETDSKLAIGLLIGRWKTKHDHLREIVEATLDLKGIKNIRWHLTHVKGHAGHDANERVNQAAHAQAKIARYALRA